MRALLKCLVSGIGGRSGVWIPHGGELSGESAGGGMSCFEETEDGLRKFSGYRMGVLVAFSVNVYGVRIVQKGDFCS